MGRRRMRRPTRRGSGEAMVFEVVPIEFQAYRFELRVSQSPVVGNYEKSEFGRAAM
jgi:hypothetical protein